jgi:uncharacterized YigZ family protein
MAEVNACTFIAPGKETDAELTVKRSRFIASVRIALTPEDAHEALKNFPTLFPKANHHCWGYRIGLPTPLEHCSDAGEPAGTAGRPILGVLKRHSLDNTLLVVTRYFGGVKLGVRGLIDAYGEAAELAVSEAGAVEMEFHNSLRLACGYEYANTLATTLRKWGVGDERQTVSYGEEVVTEIEVPCSMRGEIEPLLDEMCARGFLAKLGWGSEPLIRAKWR